MKFGPVPLGQAEGAILAHSLAAGKTRLRKGTVLDAPALAALRAAGVTEVIVAAFEPGDVTEDAAAARIAERLGGQADGIEVTPPFTGRANLVARIPGVFRVDAAAVNRLNAVDPGITLATLPDYTRVSEGMMLATVKIIPYGVPGSSLAAALAALPEVALRIAPPVIASAELVMTRSDATPPKVIDKGLRVVRERLAALGVRLDGHETVEHECAAVAAALARTTAPLVLILGATATSDARDVCPAALAAAGGRLERFGMPVDPGNLLFVGSRGTQAVVGLPGCARSPALNGADWVLERLVCGLEVGDAEIAAMGVGGLLKEIPVRPQPRAIRKVPREAGRFEVILLAAGASSRMGGSDKLLEEVDGMPLLRRTARRALESGARRVHVVLPPGRLARAAALDGLDLSVVVAEDADTGMAASLVAGLGAVSEAAEGVIVMLADMPDVTGADLDRLIAAYDPAVGREICRAAAPGGRPGHPVLFGRRFFESLSELSGDTGAREVIKAGQDYLTDVEIAGTAAVTDLDTPEDWAAWRAAR